MPWRSFVRHSPASGVGVGQGRYQWSEIENAAFGLFPWTSNVAECTKSKKLKCDDMLARWPMGGVHFVWH